MADTASTDRDGGRKPSSFMRPLAGFVASVSAMTAIMVFLSALPL